MTKQPAQSLVTSNNIVTRIQYIKGSSLYKHLHTDMLLTIE